METPDFHGSMMKTRKEMLLDIIDACEKGKQ